MRTVSMLWGNVKIAKQESEIRVTQEAHGFSVKDVIRHNGLAYLLAQANNTTNAQAVGIVTKVIDADTFVFQSEGFFSHQDFNAGDEYILSPSIAGKIVKLTGAETWSVGEVILSLGWGTTAGFKIEIDVGYEIVEEVPIVGFQGDQGADGTSVKILGNVDDYTQLPGYPDSYTGDSGDGYLTKDDGHLWVWSGSIWIDAGEIRGERGYQGYQGVTGASIKGDQGFQGNRGFQGYQGISIKGDQGASVKGDQGNQGNRGFQGYQGKTGADIKILGNVSSYINLPGYPYSYAGDSGDGYLTNDDGHLWIWNGSLWIDVGEIRGHQGFQGYQGASIKGDQGFQGTAIKGDQGDRGYQGFQGNTGTSIKGDQGYQGVKGIGEQGNQGNQGASVKGAQGDQGASVKGDQGNQGYQGGIGTQGNQGASVKGDQGFQGNQGIAGIGTQGNQGTAGVGTQGYQGYQGIAGTGSQGNQGDKGDGIQPLGSVADEEDLPGYPDEYTGDKGDTFYVEDDGNLWNWDGVMWFPVGRIKGDQGNQGNRGDDGIGVQGLRGYQGYQGASIQGNQGDQGVRGSQGFQGVTGAGVRGFQGDQGSQGNQGASVKGDQGNQGAQGAPGGGGGGGSLWTVDNEGIHRMGHVGIGAEADSENHFYVVTEDPIIAQFVNESNDGSGVSIVTRDDSDYSYPLTLYTGVGNVFSVFGSGKMQLNKYGSGNITGSATKYLAVDFYGNVIEVDGGGGGGGLPGPQGFQGNQGYQGNQGANVKGDQGFQGDRGYQGDPSEGDSLWETWSGNSSNIKTKDSDAMVMIGYPYGALTFNLGYYSDAWRRNVTGYGAILSQTAGSLDFQLAGNSSGGSSVSSFKTISISNTTGAITAENFVLSSERKYKENIKDLLGFKAIDEIKFKSFNFKADEQKRTRYGVIADDVEKIDKNLIYDENGKKSVAYIDLLIAKIARLEERIEILESR